LVPALSLFNITFMLAQAIGFILLAPLILSLLPTYTIASVVIHPVESLYLIIAVLYAVCTGHSIDSDQEFYPGSTWSPKPQKYAEP